MKHDNAQIIQDLRDHVAIFHCIGLHVYNGDAYIYATALFPKLTDSFKMVIDVAARRYLIEISGKADDKFIEHTFPSLETMVTAYMAIACFFRERVQSRIEDI